MVQPSHCLTLGIDKRSVLGTGLDVNSKPRCPAGMKHIACVHVAGLSCLRVPFAGVLVFNLTVVEHSSPVL